MDGAAIPDLLIYEIALQCGVNPAEVRTWDAEDLHTLGAVLWAKREAKQAIAKRFKLNLSDVPEWFTDLAPFEWRQNETEEQ